MQKSAAYWECILTKRDATATKKAADEALGRLLGCEAAITGKRKEGRQRRWTAVKERFFELIDQAKPKIP
jgi:hypothetical protein